MLPPLPPIFTMLLMLAHMCPFVLAENPSQLLFDVSIKCLGSSGDSAALEILWHPIVTIPHSFPHSVPGSVPAVPVHVHQPLPSTPSPVAKKKFPGILLLIGELGLFNEQQVKIVDISKGAAHLQIPAWALKEGAFSSVLLKQGDAVVGRAEFLQLGPICGHGDLRFDDIDGGRDLPEIHIH